MSEQKDAVTRLYEKFEQMKANGLRDFKVQLAPLQSPPTVEELAEEVLAMIECAERGDFVDTPEQLEKLR